MKKTVPFMLALLIAVSACGGDDGEETPNSGGAGGAGGGDSGNGSGGTSGAGAGGDGGGGTGGGGGSGGSATGPVTCGSATCEQPAAGMGFITACCADDAMSACGISLAGGSCMMTPESDERCPSIDVGGVFEIASCCTDDNLCGINAMLVGMGCIDLESAAEGGMGSMGGIPFELPQPRTCDGMLIDAGTGDDDAGM